MPQSVQEKVFEIIAKQAVINVSDVSLTQSLEDLGIDSLGLVECIFAIEETFDVEVPFNANDTRENHAFDISSVASIVNAVETLVAKA